MTESFLAYIRMHWWKAWDECNEEEREYCKYPCKGLVFCIYGKESLS